MRRWISLAAVSLGALALAQTPGPQRIVLIGDSTVCNYPASQYPWAGWGQELVYFFQTGAVTVINKAIGGRSSRSFIQDGHWATTKALLQKGDVLMIQFGTNDRSTNPVRHTDTAAFKVYLAQYINESRAMGVHPILVTPMNQNIWTGNKVSEGFNVGVNDYHGVMLRVGAAMKVPVLDLERKSAAMMDSTSMSYLAKFNFMGLDAGEYPNYPTGYSDATHFQETGALANARMVTEEIARQASDTILKILAPLLAPVNVVTVKSTVTGDTISRTTSYPKGATVTVKVKPAKGKTFLYWLGDKNAKVATTKRYTYVQDDQPHTFVAVYQGATGIDLAPGVATPGMTAASNGRKWTVEGAADLGTVDILRQDGRRMLSQAANGRVAEMDLGSLPPGIYLARSSRLGSTVRLAIPR
jgi:lysophospholipase L1-like esterase